jgi:hypothetical protein
MSVRETASGIIKSYQTSRYIFEAGISYCPVPLENSIVSDNDHASHSGAEAGVAGVRAVASDCHLLLMAACRDSQCTRSHITTTGTFAAPEELVQVNRLPFNSVGVWRSVPIQFG